MPPTLLDARGRRRTPMMDPSTRRGRAPANKGRRYPAEVFEPAEVAALIKQCSTKYASGVRNRALIACLYGTGIRISEALQLAVKDVNVTQSTIRVLWGKGQKARTVVIEPQCLALVQIWIARRARLELLPRAPLFCTISADPKAGRQMSTTSVRLSLKRIAEKAGVDKRIHPHGFRHTHAWELANQSIPMHAIQQQLGHTSLAVTGHYVGHLSGPAACEALRNRLAPALSHPSAPVGVRAADWAARAGAPTSPLA